MNDPRETGPGDAAAGVEERLSRLERGYDEARAWVRDHNASAALRAEVSRRRLRRSEADLEAAGGGGWSWRPQVASPRFSPACHRVLGPERRGLGLGRRPRSGASAASPGLRDTRDVCLARLHPDDLGAFELELDRFLRGGSPRFHRRVRVRDDAGHWLEVVVAAGVTDADENGRVARMAGVVLVVPPVRGAPATDTSNGSRVELDERREELDALARLARHDLRSPLRTIVGFSEHLGPLVVDDSDAADAVARIRRAGDRMIELVDRVTVYATLGRTPRRDDAVELDAVLREALRHLEGKIDAIDASVTVGRLPAVRGDAGMLGHVFEQIIENALRFVGTDPPIVRIEAQTTEPGGSAAPGESVRIHVTDGGVGFDPAMAEAMFEPYRRLDHASSGGTGMGLCIARRAVERHGGTLTAEPAPDGPGSRFVIVLPAAGAGAGAALPSPRSEHAPPPFARGPDPIMVSNFRTLFAASAVSLPAAAGLVVTEVDGPPTGDAVRIQQLEREETGPTSFRYYAPREGEPKKDDPLVYDPDPTRSQEEVAAEMEAFYFYRDRDLGQTFTTGAEGFRLGAVTVRLQPVDVRGGGDPAGAKVSLQLMKVTGTPRVNDNGTPAAAAGEPPTRPAWETYAWQYPHDPADRNVPKRWPVMHASDDFLEGETYEHLSLASGGVVPATLDLDDYLRWDLTGDSEVFLEPNTTYAIVFLFDEPAPPGVARNIPLSNMNVLPGGKLDDVFPGGHMIRRDGSSTDRDDVFIRDLEPERPGLQADPADLETAKQASAFPLDMDARLAIQPGTLGYPDVDTYRDLWFVLEAAEE